MNIIKEIINGKILEIHGAAGTGKTNLSLYLANLISKKTLVFFIFTENLPFDRFNKFCSTNVIPIKVNSFLELYDTIDKLINNGVIIIDSLGYFYRLTRDDGLLESLLKKLKNGKYGAIILNQVRENIIKNKTVPIGWHKLKKYVDFVFELKNGKINITKPKYKCFYFEINEEGVKIYGGK